MIRFREATSADIPAIVALLSDDVLGQGREAADLEPYEKAFAAMAEEPGNILIVGEFEAGRVVATYQFTLMTGLSQKGLRRAQLEAIRVASEVRGQGIGLALMEDAELRARAADAGLMQFTSNKKRDRAHAFYERLGIVPTHEGFKKPL